MRQVHRNIAMKKSSFLLLAGLVAGCVSIRSNVKPGGVPEVKRVLVVTRLYEPQPPRNYEQRYLGIFPKEYEVCVVGITALSFNPDSLINEQARQCRSDVMLTVALRQQGVTDTYQIGDVLHNNSTSSEYLAEMKSIATGQPFWKAQFSGSVGGTLPPRMVVKQLLKDGVLKGKMPPQTVIR